MAYAWDAERKLTRHLGLQMAKRRETHPVTLHLQTKCLKNKLLILTASYYAAILTLLVMPALLCICKRKLTCSLLICSLQICQLQPVFALVCVLLQRLTFSHPHSGSHPVCSASPVGAAPPLPGVGRPTVDGCDVEALGLCCREAGATTGIPRTSLGYL